MKKFSTLFALIALVAVVGTATAQQMEVNDATGSLQINNVDPTPGSPAVINLQGNPVINVGLDGGANEPVILFLSLGAVAPTSTLVGGLPAGTEWFDLDQTTSIRVLLDGIGGAGAIPFFNSLDNNGSMDLAFTANAALLGLSFSWQGVIQDATAPFNLNFTAAEQTDIASFTPPVVVTGDDVLTTVNLVNGPISFYGTSYTQVEISTNGWVKFGTSATFSDLSESTADFISGNIGGGGAGSGAAIAVIWEDVDMGNNPTQSLVFQENPAGNAFTMTYNNADYFSSTTFGTVSASVVGSSAGLGASVVLDYTGYTLATPPTEGLIGVTAGGTLPTAGNDVEADLFDVIGGVNNVVVPPIPAMAATIFQNFDGTGLFSEVLDVAGTVLTFQEGTPFVGDFIMF